MMITIGIDPGKKGGVAVFRGEILLFVEPIPVHDNEINHHELIRLLKFPKAKVFIERAQAMPMQGVVSMFDFGKTFGTILGICYTLNHAVVRIRPTDWKHYCDLKGSNKKCSIIRCKELYPNVNLKPSSRHRVDHDGMAEAILIGRYGVFLQKE